MIGNLRRIVDLFVLWRAPPGAPASAPRAPPPGLLAPVRGARVVVRTTAYYRSGTTKKQQYMARALVYGTHAQEYCIQLDS